MRDNTGQYAGELPQENLYAFQFSGVHTGQTFRTSAVGHSVQAAGAMALEQYYLVRSEPHNPKRMAYTLVRKGVPSVRPTRRQ